MTIEEMMNDSVEENVNGTQQNSEHITEVKADDVPKGSENKTVEGASPDNSFDFKKEFDGYESVSQVKELADRGNKFSTEVENEFNRLRQLENEFKTGREKMEKFKSSYPYKNETFYKMDKLAETDPEHADLYQKFLLNEKNMSDREMVRLGELLDFGDVFKDNETALKRRLDSRYPALYDSTDSEEAEYKDDLINLSIDAKKVRKRFDEKIAGIEPAKTFGQTVEEKASADEEFANSWRTGFSKVKEELTTIPINVQDEKDAKKEVKVMDIPLSDEDSKEVSKIAANYIIQNRLKPTDENVDLAKKVAVGSYILKNFSKIQTAFANKITEDTGIKWRSKVTNPQANNEIHSPVRNTGTAIGSADAIVEDIMNRAGGVGGV